MEREWRLARVVGNDVLQPSFGFLLAHKSPRAVEFNFWRVSCVSSWTLRDDGLLSSGYSLCSISFVWSMDDISGIDKLCDCYDCQTEMWLVKLVWVIEEYKWIHCLAALKAKVILLIFLNKVFGLVLALCLVLCTPKPILIQKPQLRTFVFVGTVWLVCPLIVVKRHSANLNLISQIKNKKRRIWEEG